MQYINFNGHRYGIYLTYVESRVKLVLVENKQRVCDLSSFLALSKLASFDTGYVYVDVTKLSFAEELMSELKCTKTGREITVLNGDRLIEYDVSSLVKFNNREMKRNQMKKGMVQIAEGRGISTNIIWYGYHLKNKKEDKYIFVTTEGLKIDSPKEFFEKAVETYHIPVYTGFRKEPF